MSARSAKLNGPVRAFCCLTTFLNRLCHRPTYNRHIHGFYCLSIIQYIRSRQTIYMHPHHVSDPFYTNLRKSKSLARFLFLYHLTDHQPTIPRTCFHLRCNRCLIHLLYHRPNLHQKCLRQRDRTLPDRGPSYQATTLHSVRHLAKFKYRIHVSIVSLTSLYILLHSQICIHLSLQCPSKCYP